MKVARLVGLIVAAVMALSLAVASAAFAEPEFKPTGGTFTGTSSTTNKLVAGANKIVCTGNTTSGKISNAFLAGGVTVSFTGCKSSGSKVSNCTAKSVGAAEGTITTSTLDGLLGLILAKGSGTGVALVLKPATGEEFVDIAKNGCTVETAVEGSVAGEVSPVGHSQTTGKLLFDPSTSGGSEETIKTVDLSSNGATVSPALTAFGLPASQETTESLTFSPAVEVS
jgi:hypothetical protein